MRSEVLASPPANPKIYSDYVFPALTLIAPFIAGLLVGVAFTQLIRRRGWRPQVISVWPISVMSGVLAYVIVPAIAIVVFVVLTDFKLSMIAMGLSASLFYTWPIWLVMGPVFFIYIAYLKRREKWLRDSTVYRLAALSLVAECAFIVWLFPH